MESLPEGIETLEETLPLTGDRPDEPLANGTSLEAELVEDGPQENAPGKAGQGELEEFAEPLTPASSAAGTWFFVSKGIRAYRAAASGFHFISFRFFSTCATTSWSSPAFRSKVS